LELTICQLYPSTMSTYGDRGNVIALAQRARWRGIEVTVTTADLHQPISCGSTDIFFFGGGQDKEQIAVSEDLRGKKGEQLVAAVADGAVLLSICGGYQLLGEYFHTSTGEDLPGLGVFQARTTGGPQRMIGDIVIEADGLGNRDGPVRLVGFENHSGQTFLESGCRPLGKVVVGSGNNGIDRTEGARYRNAFGCYLHGPLLPKNPVFTDYLLQTALLRRYGEETLLPPLESDIEDRAREAVVRRISKRGRVNSAIKH
jgi:lipid II isoglutaminyl synthase (glutamine-hydrolysing)